MTLLKKGLIPAALILLYLAPAAYPDPQEPNEYKLEFKMSEDRTWPHRERYDPKSKYVAILFVKRDTGYYLRTSTRGDHPYRQEWRSAFENVGSQEQRDFNNKYSFATPAPPSFVFPPKDSTAVCIHGVSRKDVEVMVNSAIKWSNDMVRTYFRGIKDQIQERIRQKPQLEKEIEDLKKEQEDLKVKVEELKTKSRYQEIEEIKRVIEELNKVLELVELDIIGIRAKLNTIKEQNDKLQKADTKYAQGAFELLFQLRLAQEVELGGALARKIAAQSRREEISRFLAMLQRLDALPRVIESTKETLSKNISRTRASERALVDMPTKGWKPVELTDNKVVIYPVSYEE